MTDPKTPAPLELDSTFLTPLDPVTPDAPAVPAPSASTPSASAPAPAPAPVSLEPAPSPAAPAAPAASASPPTTFPLVPLSPDAIPPAFKKAVDPSGPAPGRMMAARAMAPIPPKTLIPIIYQLMMDPDPKIAGAAHKTFHNLDEKLVMPALAEALPPPVLEGLAHVLEPRFHLLEKVLVNRSTPDTAFAYLAEHASDNKAIGLIVENQERLLRYHDIVRGLSRNVRALRSDLDKAVDFLVREGIYLEEVQAFEDAFLRLGKADMLAVLKNIKVQDEHLSDRERAKARELGMSADEFVMSGADVLTEEEREALLAELNDDDEDDSGKDAIDWSKMPFSKLPIPIQIKVAMTGPHEKAIEALNSPNRVVAGSAIRNPKIKENDVVKIARNKTMHEDVIRYICNNGDWTKSYGIKFSLVQNPKTPPSLVGRWMPLLRANDLRSLAKSKQVPSAVSIMARRMINNRDQK